MNKRLITILLSLFIVIAIAGVMLAQQKEGSKPAFSVSELKGLQKAYFASGCFWCVEGIFESVKGVREAISGYTGGDLKNPTYQQVSTGKTGHAEAVEVYYDPAVISYQDLLKVFFASHNPTTPNQQGPDYGTQYRSAIFYQNEEEKKTAAAYIKQLDASGKYERKIVTELIPFDTFYEAEEYHQNFEKNNPNNPYVRRISKPRLERFKIKVPEMLKKNHE